MIGKWIETAATAALVAGCLAIVGCAAARQRRRPAPAPRAHVTLVAIPAQRTVEALVVPFGAPRHDWPGGTVTSLHTPATLRRVVRRFAQDGRPVPLVEETDPHGPALGWVVALRVEGDGLHARFALAGGTDLAGRFLAPSLQEEVTDEHPATAVPIRLARVLVTDKPSLPAPEEI